MLYTGRLFLNATNDGLDILKHYLEHEFTLNTEVIVGELKFQVTFNDRYQNYAIYIHTLENGKWEALYRLNPIWFVKEKFELTEEETYLKIQKDMGLNIIPIEEQIHDESPNIEKLAKMNNVSENYYKLIRS